MSNTKITEYLAYCKQVIVLDYYDGPTLGLGISIDGGGMSFKWIGENLEDSVRLFLVAPLDVQVVDKIWAQFALTESPRKPVWWLNADGKNNDDAYWQEVVSTVEAKIYSSHDLFLLETIDFVGATRGLLLTSFFAKKARKILQSGQVVSLQPMLMLDNFLQQMEI